MISPKESKPKRQLPGMKAPNKGPLSLLKISHPAPYNLYKESPKTILLKRNFSNHLQPTEITSRMDLSMPKELSLKARMMIPSMMQETFMFMISLKMISTARLRAMEDLLWEVIGQVSSRSWS